MALRCAALAAKHPDPDCFISAWLTISSRLDEAVSLLAKLRCGGAPLPPASVTSRSFSAGRRRTWTTAVETCC
jgi:hypothetical protein